MFDFIPSPLHPDTLHWLLLNKSNSITLLPWFNIHQLVSPITFVIKMQTLQQDTEIP